MNSRAFDRFILRHGRQDAGEALRQHRFSRPRRPNEKDIVSASGRNFQRSFRVLLPSNFRKIGHPHSERILSEQWSLHRRYRLSAVEKLNHLWDRHSRIDRHSIDNRGLRPIFLGDKKAFDRPILKE
jgi:hypothetical protein